MVLSLKERRCLYRSLWLFQNPQKPRDMLRYFDKDVWKSLLKAKLLCIDKKKRLSITDDGVALAKKLFVSKRYDIDKMVATGRNLHDVDQIDNNDLKSIYANLF